MFEYTNMCKYEPIRECYKDKAYHSFDDKYTLITDVLERIFELAKCDLNVHGHVHSNSLIESKIHINSSVEVLKFKPQKLKV